MVQERCCWERHLSPSCAYVINSFEPEINLKQINTIFIFNNIFFPKQAVSGSVSEVFIKNRIWKECVFQGIRRLRERFELNICIIIFYLPPTERVCVCMGGGGKSNFKIKKWHQAKNATPQGANKQKCLPKGRNTLTVMLLRSRMQHFNNDCKSSPCCVTDI